jgi:hypothetical protein
MPFRTPRTPTSDSGTALEIRTAEEGPGRAEGCLCLNDLIKLVNPPSAPSQVLRLGHGCFLGRAAKSQQQWRYCWRCDPVGLLPLFTVGSAATGSKALLEPGAFRSAADGAIGRLVWAPQEPHQWFFDPGRPHQSDRLLRFLRPRARFASYVGLES